MISSVQANSFSRLLVSFPSAAVPQMHWQLSSSTRKMHYSTCMLETCSKQTSAWSQLSCLSICLMQRSQQKRSPHWAVRRTSECVTKQQQWHVTTVEVAWISRTVPEQHRGLSVHSVPGTARCLTGSVLGSCKQRSHMLFTNPDATWPVQQVNGHQHSTVVGDTFTKCLRGLHLLQIPEGLSPGVE